MEGENNNVVEVKQTVEVLDQKGATMNRDTPLAGIFDKIEAGKGEGKTAEQVVKESAPTQPAKEEKVEESLVVASDDNKTQKKTDLDQKLTEVQKQKDDEEVTREQLRKQSDPKQGPANDGDKKPIGKKEEPAKKDDAKKEDDVPDEELQVLPHDKPKTAKRIQALLKKIDVVSHEATATKKDRDEKAAKLADLEKKLADVKTVNPETDDKVKKQLDELTMYRRRYALDADPEIKTKFDGRVDSAEKAIIDTLAKRGAGDALIEIIKKEGGWLKFSESGRSITLNDGKQVTAAELADAIMSNLPLSERKSVDAAMMEQIQTKRDKERFFQEEQAKASEYFKKQEDESAKAREAQQKGFQEVNELVTKWQSDVVAKNDWLREKEVPSTATAEQKAAIEEDNKYTRQLNQLLNKSVKATTVQEALEITLDSVRFYQERRETNRLIGENKKLQADLAAKQAELDRFKGAGKTVKHAGSISTAAQPVTSKDAKPVSLEAAFDAIARGELGGGE